ncbi:Protein transport protein SEC61 gamma subunit [Zostera marina]|uniref:Protein transport protein SEC61 gamma subunit n=1 Tax=Zostera marina TaxID=29655 RepID=A0A0K9NXF7_ZOSMR|nr:Protein transport protein SEC61 gamma subunit [Zostera marina]
MDVIDSAVDPLRDFAKDSIRLVKRCHKPDRKEFSKVAVRTAIGFVVMGFVGFFVKLIFIPINNIIVGSDDNSTYGDENLANVMMHQPSSGFFLSFF